MNTHNFSKNIRLRDYDYRNGWFFVTNKTDFAKEYFTDTLRDLVKKQLFELVDKTDGVGIDYFHIMPNHIHAILIFDTASLSLSKFWRRFKALTTIYAKKAGFTGKSLLQNNFYEHVIRNEKSLEHIRKYIKNNPLKQELLLEEIYEGVNRPAR